MVKNLPVNAGDIRYVGSISQAWQSTPVFLPGESQGWESLGMGEPGGLPSMGSHRVVHD